MKEGRLQVSFEGPSFFLGQSLPVEIRDARNHLVARATGPVDMPVAAGLYRVEATLPGGKRYSEVLSVAEGAPTNLVLHRGMADEVEAAGSEDSPSLVSSPRDELPPAVLLDNRACRPLDQRGSKWTFEPLGEPDQTPRATFAIAGTTVTVSLPLNPRGKPEEKGCTVQFLRRGQRVRVDVGFGRKRQVASTLEGLVKSHDVISTGTLFDKAEGILYAKYQDPAAAALGGLTLHRIGRLGERADWVENLARDFRWVADGRILLAALLAKDPESKERARGLQELLEVAPVRPLFSDGLALLLQLLRTWPDKSSADERRAVLETMPTDAATVDWDAMALTNYDED